MRVLQGFVLGFGTIGAIATMSFPDVPKYESPFVVSVCWGTCVLCVLLTVTLASAIDLLCEYPGIDR